MFCLRSLSTAQVDRLVQKTRELVRKSEHKTPKRDVTKAQIKRSSRVKASLRTIGRRFDERKVTFGPDKEKLVLSKEDMAARLEWVREAQGRAPVQHGRQVLPRSRLGKPPGSRGAGQPGRLAGRPS